MDSASLLKNYKNFQTGRLKPEDYVKRYTDELGVSGVRDRVNNARSAIRSTEDVISQTPDSVAGRTSNSLVTDGQRNRLVTMELEPLQNILRTQTNAFGDARSELSSLEDRVDSRANMAYQNDDTQATSLLTLYQAATEREKAAEERRQFEEQLKLAKQKEAREAVQAKNSFAPSFNTGNSAGTAANDRMAAISAEANRIKAQKNADSTASKVGAATKQTQRYSGAQGFINWLGDVGPWALFGGGG